jgi:hypothetical protein
MNLWVQAGLYICVILLQWMKIDVSVHAPTAAKDIKDASLGPKEMFAPRERA